MQRRAFLLHTASLAAALGQPAWAASDTVRIGYQKSSFNLIVLKARGTLEKRLAAQHVGVRWVEFPAGPQLLEALNVGSIDFGMTGDTPPVFAQAAGTHLVYIGHEPAKPQASAILVPQGSPLKSLAELRGKRIAFQRGSSAHYLVLRALAQAGHTLAEVDVANLAPADARAAFERGSVDAWAIWDPYYAAAEKALPTRALTTGDGLVANHTFYLASRDFAQQRPEIISALFEELTRNDALLRQQPGEVARILSDYVGLDVATFDTVIARRPSFEVRFLDDRVVDAQQHIADTFFQIGVIPHAITVRDIVWRPGRRLASTPSALGSADSSRFRLPLLRPEAGGGGPIHTARSPEATPQSWSV